MSGYVLRANPTYLIPPTMPTFIETQFPIARLSAESYKERKANNSQTLYFDSPVGRVSRRRNPTMRELAKCRVTCFALTRPT